MVNKVRLRLVLKRQKLAYLKRLVINCCQYGRQKGKLLFVDKELKTVKKS